VCALARTFEAAGLATVSLISVRGVAERLPPPRALYCEFPLGRPLGRPDDAEFQHDVLSRAFALLDRATGPVLEDHPVVIESDVAPLACPMPPRFDPSLPEAVDEARALRAAYDRTRARTGVTSVGRVVDADGVPAALDALARIAGGASWKDAGLSADPVRVAHDIRAYYEEAADALVDGPPNAGQGEIWFYEQTAAGRTLLAARTAMKEQDAPFPIWFYMARATR
jgi:D-proline reductase (dithiol) PrdB